MKMLQNNSSNLCYKSLDLLLLSLIHKTKFPLKVLPRKTFRNFCERGIPGCMYVCLYVCMYVSRAQKQQMGTWGYMCDRKKGQKTKRSPWQHHDYILFYLSIYLFIYLFIYFLGEKIVNLYPPNTLYIHYCSEFSKKK